MVKSELGEGSVFKSSIPVVVPANAKLVPLKRLVITPPLDPMQVDLKGLEVLVVEDSPDNQFLIQKMLGKMPGYPKKKF